MKATLKDALKQTPYSERQLYERVQEMYSDLLEDLDLRTIEEIKEITGIEPRIDYAKIKQAFDILLKRHARTHFYDKDLFESCVYQIEEFFGVKREFNYGEVQKAYKNILLCNGANKGTLELIKNLEEIFGYKLSEQIIQKVYKKYIKDVFINDIESLKEFTGIEPHFDEEFIKNLYKEISSKAIKWSDARGYLKILKIYNVTKMAPSQDIINDLYRVVVLTVLDSHRSLSDDVKQKLKELINASGLKPQVDIEYVQRQYFNLLTEVPMNGAIDTIEYLMDIFYLPISEGVIHRTYWNLLEHHKLKEIIDLKKWSGVEPKLDKDKVIASYRALLKRDFVDRYLDFIIEIQEITNIYLPEDIVQEAYNYHFKNKGYYNVINIMHRTGIPPSKESYGVFVSSIFSN